MDVTVLHILLHLNAATLLIFAYVTFWFIVSLSVKRNDVADIAWGPGIALVAMYMLLLTPMASLRMELLAAMAFVWGVRLALHIFQRFAVQSEDRRYVAMRAHWKGWFMPRSYAQVFLLQGLLMLVVSYPFVHANAYATVPFTWFDLLGVLIWTIGLLTESLSDRALRLFKANPQNTGKVLDSGLWKYSRHPNYFGEVLQWWGIGIVLLSVPYGWVALISPLLMTLLITRISGIPAIERTLARNAQYRAYMERTSRLIPYPRKTPLVVDEE